MSPRAEPNSGADRLRLLQGPWPAVVLGILCFLSSVGNGFTYDDVPMVLENTRIRSLTNFESIWLSDWWKTREVGADKGRDRLYRPLTMYSFAVNYAFSGNRPPAYHATNIALHGLACLLVWSFARRLIGDDTTASIAAVLFAVHPVHAEAVANVVGRAEILSTVFLLLGLLALLPRRDPPAHGRAAIAALAFLAALLAKETAVSYPGLAAIVLYWRQRGRPRRWWLEQAGWLLLPLVIYLPLRLFVMDGQLVRSLPAAILNPLADAEGMARVLGPFTILGHYVRLLLVPQWLSADYGLAIIDPERGVTLMTAVGLLATIGMVVGLWGWRRREGAWRPVALLTALFVVSYALISNAVLLIGVSLAERLMYWPSVPALLLAAVGLRSFWHWQLAPGRPLAERARLVSALGVLVIAALGLRSGLRSLDWQDNITLFTRDASTWSRGAQLNHLCGAALLDLFRRQQPPRPEQDSVWAEARRHLAARGLWRADWPAERKRIALLEAALDHLDRSLEIYPPNAEALTVRGRVRRLLGDRVGARRDLENALLLKPNHEEARKVLAHLDASAAAIKERLASLARQVEETPADAAAREAYGTALLQAGRHLQALPELEEAVKLAPDNATAWRALGKVRAVLQEEQRAIQAFEQAAALDPNDWQSHANLSTLYGKKHPAEALDHARRAFALQPNDLRCAMNLAEAHAVNNNRDEALSLFRQIAARLPAGDPLRGMVLEKIRKLQRGGS